MVDQLQWKLNPLFLGDNLHKILLDLDRIGMFGKVEPPRDTLDVCIHYNPGRDSIVTAQNNIGRFASGSRNRDQLLHGLGDLPAKISENLAGGSDQGFGLVPEETGGPDVIANFFQICIGEVADGWIFLE